jgi:predicted phosphoribosyltransferase
VVVASPVASIQAADVVRVEVDDFVCLATPALFQAVGVWYEHFPQTSDAEVEETLTLAREI